MEKRENIGWIDLLRVVACFLVVFSHCCDAFVAQFEIDRISFLTGVVYGSFVRPCVPLFVMMTAVLLLPVKQEIGPFYRKRIGRLIPPLIFWSITLPIVYFLYLNYGVTTSSPSIDMNDHTLQATLPKLYTFIFNFNYDTVPFWYLYMLIGLYLVMPIISSWLKQASRKDLKLVLCIWGVSLVLPYLKMIAPTLGYTGNWGNMGLLGECDWNEYGTFYYLSGFVGYLMLAYYLVKYPLDWNWKKMLIICIPMFLVGYLITAYGFVLMQNHFPGNYAYLEIIWYFAGINVFMMTFPIFVIVQKMNVPLSATLSRMASLSFGIYLCHFVIVQMGYDLFDSIYPLPAFVRIPGMAIFSFVVSYGVVWIMSKSSLTRRFIA